MDHEKIIDATRQWIASIVIELNLCPFAQRVFDGQLIRYVVSEAEDEASLLKELATELRTLADAPISAVESTLLIHPRALADFLDYNDFLTPAEQLVRDLDLEGVIQIAGFHPHYQFAGTDAEAVENYTNRSPYPMLHLLREESITRAAAEPDELLEIPKRNVETLKQLGLTNILERLRQTFRP